MNSFPVAAYLITLVFAVAVLATVAGALVAVLTTRIIRSVCGLALCCCGLAGLYYFLQSPFLTLMEILIYVGAICVTIIFAVMLAEPDEKPVRETTAAWLGWGGCALGVSLAAFWGLSRLSLGHAWTSPAVRVNSGSVKDIGVALLTTYSLAFELISIVLFIAIVGALVIAREGRTRPVPATANSRRRQIDAVAQEPGADSDGCPPLQVAGGARERRRE
jgi:NADH:ubiquinone oxidoreductase subunit 6 (subunit J)